MSDQEAEGDFREETSTITTACEAKRKQQAHLVPEEARPLTEEEIELVEKVRAHFAKLDKGYIIDDTMRANFQKLVEKVRAHFAKLDKGYIIDDTMLIKFVRGYHFETPRLEKTIAIMERTLIFRKEQRVDFIVEEKGEDETKFRRTVWPYHIHGHDKKGHPVYYEQIGRVDPETVMKYYCLSDVKMFHCVTMERLEAMKKEISERTGNRTYKHTVILDLTGFGWKHCSRKLYEQLKSTMDMYQYFYPEALQRFYIINAPRLFKGLWAVVSPWLHQRTRDQINFCKYGRHLEDMQEHIDIDQIPRHYGGKCPGCDACDEDHFSTSLELDSPPTEVIPRWTNTEVKPIGDLCTKN